MSLRLPASTSQNLGFWTASITNGFLCKNQGQNQVFMLARQALYQPSHRLSAP